MKDSTKWAAITAGWLALVLQSIETQHGGVIACAALVTLIIWHELNQAAADRRAKRNAKRVG